MHRIKQLHLRGLWDAGSRARPPRAKTGAKHSWRTRTQTCNQRQFLRSSLRTRKKNTHQYAIEKSFNYTTQSTRPTYIREKEKKQKKKKENLNLETRVAKHELQTAKMSRATAAQFLQSPASLTSTDHGPPLMMIVPGIAGEIGQLQEAAGGGGWWAGPRVWPTTHRANWPSADTARGTGLRGLSSIQSAEPAGRCDAVTGRGGD